MKNLLVLCTGNSCRSQMAEGYLRTFCGDRAQVHSAGIEAHGLNGRAIEVMQEDGIDISHHSSNTIDEYRHMQFDYVITVCDHARENCPFFPAQAKQVHRNFMDPAKAIGTEEEIMQSFRSVRDEIKKFCLEFAQIYV